MKKYLLICALVFSAFVQAADKKEEFSVGIIKNVFIHPALDTTVAGIAFIDYTYFFNDNIGLGFFAEETVRYIDAAGRKLDIPSIGVSFTARTGNGTFYLPAIVKVGPELAITAGNVDFGFHSSVQTGLEIFANDSVGVRFLVGPTLGYISGFDFGIRFDSGVIIRF